MTVKTCCDHIIDKSRLTDAGVRMLTASDQFLVSLGFGQWLVDLGGAMAEMYRIIRELEPNMPIPHLPGLKMYLDRYPENGRFGG